MSHDLHDVWDLLTFVQSQFRISDTLRFRVRPGHVQKNTAQYPNKRNYTTILRRSTQEHAAILDCFDYESRVARSTSPGCTIKNCGQSLLAARLNLCHRSW